MVGAMRARCARVTVAVAMAAALSACSSSAEIKYSGDRKGFDKATRFTVAETVDRSGFVFEDKSEAFALDQAFQLALKAAISRQGLNGQGVGAYTLKSEVVHYKPGNAFARWLMPGAGATELDTLTHVYDAENNEVATIPASTMIAAGGGYTVGAYKTVFNDNAIQVADKLRQNVAP